MLIHLSNFAKKWLACLAKEVKICVVCGEHLPNENKEYSDKYATPLTCGAQSSLLYFLQLLYFQIYQLRQNEKDLEKQKALNLGLIKNTVEILEGVFDQIFVLSIQFSFMSVDYCKECGIKEINFLARIAGWDKYKDKFNELFPRYPLNSFLSDSDLESLNMVFTLKNLIGHAQPLRISLIPNVDHKTIFGDFLGNQHEKLVSYFIKKGYIDPSDKQNLWTWDVLMQDGIFLWARDSVRACIDKLKTPNSFPHFHYVQQMGITVF